MIKVFADTDKKIINPILGYGVLAIIFVFFLTIFLKEENFKLFLHYLKETKNSIFPNSEFNPHGSSNPNLEIQVQSEMEMERNLEVLYMVLFVYYIDNKRFPSEEEGIVYGLLKTGKNSPYLPIIEKRTIRNYYPFLRKNLVRKDGKTPIKNNEILPGDQYLDPFGEVYPYKLNNTKNRFELLNLEKSYVVKEIGKSAQDDIESFFMRMSAYEVLKFDNLPYLKYTIEDSSIPRCYIFHRDSYLSFELER